LHVHGRVISGAFDFHKRWTAGDPIARDNGQTQFGAEGCAVSSASAGHDLNRGRCARRAGSGAVHARECAEPMDLRLENAIGMIERFRTRRRRIGVIRIDG